MITKTRTMEILNTIDTNGCLKFPFNFLGVTLLESSTAGSDIKKIAIDNGRPLCLTTTVLATKTLYKACDDEIDYHQLATTHPVHQYMNDEVWDDRGNCKDESLLLCAVSKGELMGACKAKSGFVGNACDC